MEKEPEKKMDICISESICCIPVTNTVKQLYSNKILKNPKIQIRLKKKKANFLFHKSGLLHIGFQVTSC